MRRARPTSDALLPPAIAAWPAVLLREGAGGGARRRSGDDRATTDDAAPPPASAQEDASDGTGPDLAALLARIRAEALFWPVPRARAATPRALALGPAWLGEARARFPDADIACATDLAAVAPDRLEAVFGPWEAPARLWARIGGLAAPTLEEEAPPEAPLAAARGVSPWTGEALGLEDAVEAQALLHAAARRARGPVRLVGMSPWKRACLTPFLTGPDGPPRRLRRGPPARPVGPLALWGAAEEVGAEGALRVEDGFLRSVGLGLRHTPPVSLTIDPRPPYFDATRPNAFEACVAAAEFTPRLLARAARLRARVVALGLTKYNVGEEAPLPDPGGREAVLVPGQVARDASIRLGATTVRSDLDLLEATRARFPEAFLLYKPHPDVLTGLRAGSAPAEAAARLADATIGGVSAAACLAWADRVATITSLMGFEALLRGKAVTAFGRPFYSGWGLTDDADPAPPSRRPRRLTLDALVAAALILHPAYVDPATRLPCPPEIALERLARERAEAGRPRARLRRLWRDGVSWALNAI